MLCALICEIRSQEKSFVYIEENPQRNRNVKSIKSTYKSRKYLMSAETNKNNYWVVKLAYFSILFNLNFTVAEALVSYIDVICTMNKFHLKYLYIIRSTSVSIRGHHVQLRLFIFENKIIIFCLCFVVKLDLSTVE